MAKTSAQLDREIAENLAARQISDRRIAYLTSKGENTRNTPAWRDAMSEQRAIRFMTSTPRPSPPDVREHFTITWYAVPNANKVRGGYMPVYEHGGKVRGDTYGRGYPKAEAEQLAEERARKEADRFTGDWNITVKKGKSSRAHSTMKAAPTKPPHAKGWDQRAFHEERVVELLSAAKNLWPRIGEGYCEGRAIQALITANRYVAQARTHLVSIGPQEGKRTKRLFAAVSKLERDLKKATDKTIAKCPKE